MVLYADTDVTYPCWKDSSGARGTLATAADLPHGPRYNGSQDVQLGAAAVPAGVAPVARILMIDGKPEEVWLTTDGPDSQGRLYQLLVAKYGKPDSTNLEQLQNGYGARYDGISATWRFQNMTLEFDGVLSHDSGAIVARTAAGAAFMRERMPLPAASF
jgi:hypothetical protein